MSSTSSTGWSSGCSLRPGDPRRPRQRPPASGRRRTSSSPEVLHDHPLATAAAPIGDYGLLGDTRTAALVAGDGGIDWLCVPRFDGDPLFGRLVGGPAAGTFRVGPAGPATVVVRRYRQHTATLETTWEVGGGRLTLTEGMVAELAGRLLPTTLLVRRLSAEGGPVDAVVEFDPRLGAPAPPAPGPAPAARTWCVSGGRSRCRWAARPS